MFFIFSLVALLAWSGSDLFSKMGTSENDKNSHWKVVFAVGFIMGIHFLITLVGGQIIDNTVGIDNVPKFIGSLFYTDFVFSDFLVYLPVAGLYIFAMVLGYIGLRYIELSISSPICNCSGSLALLLCALIWWGDLTLDIGSIIGVVLITVGIISLSFVESNEDEELKVLRRKESNKKYVKSIWALLLPVLYLIIDALGTVGDELLFSVHRCMECGKLFIISDTCVNCGLLHSESMLEMTGIITDYASNSAFELTFFVLAIFAFIWVKFIKKDTLFAKKNRLLYVGGICETIGQIFYMAVMFADYSVGMVIISAYCVLSLLWSRIVIKEKLSLKHYITISITVIGIILLGIFSPV